MNPIRIPSHLTETSVRVQRPFRTAFRLANGKAPGAIPAFFARANLYWRKLLERRGNHRISANFRHTHFLIHLGQRINLHFTWQPVVMRARQPTSPMTRSAASPKLFLDNPLPPQRQSAMVAALFRPWTAIASPFDRWEMATLSPWPMVFRRDNRSLDQPDASPIKTISRRQIDRLDAIPSWAEGSGTKTLAWSRRVSMDRQSEFGPRFSLRRPTTQDQRWPRRVATGTPSWTEPGFRLRRATAPDRMEPAPVTHEGFARLTGAKGIDAVPDSVALTLAARGRGDPSSQAPSAVPLRLVWRESAPGNDIHPLAATTNRHDLTFGEHVSGSTATDHLEDTNEKLITRAREVMRRELLSGSTVERLADDVMRRLDKRMRIERERRGL